MTPEEVIKRVNEDNVSFIHLQFVDLPGSLKEITITPAELPHALSKGVWFDGSSIDGFVRIFESDMILKPDTSTYSLLPWTSGATKSCRMLCDVYQEEQPFPGDPRWILKQAAQRARAQGYTYYTGPEVEFFLLERKDGGMDLSPHDHAGYFDAAPTDLATEFRKEVILALHAMGIPAEAAHHEVAIGQHEIDIRYGEAVQTADNVMTLKYVIRSIASRHNLAVTFMPKPYFGINGSGMHTHQSLFRGSENAFFDANGHYRLSDLAHSFVAGQIRHARALSAILSPTVNSYKRLVPGYEAPIYVCWAQVNRAAWIRVPRTSPGRESSTRVELRSPDPSCNPYLAFAVMLSAGLDGIANRLSPPPPVEENIYHLTHDDIAQKNITTLPASLNEALTALKEDFIVRDTLGPHAYEKFLEAAESDITDYREQHLLQVSKWEKQRYMNR